MWVRCALVIWSIRYEKLKLDKKIPPWLDWMCFLNRWHYWYNCKLNFHDIRNIYNSTEQNNERPVNQFQIHSRFQSCEFYVSIHVFIWFHMDTLIGSLAHYLQKGGKFSSSRWYSPVWCTGRATSPGETGGCRRWRGRAHKGWRTPLGEKGKLHHISCLWVTFSNS